MSLDRHAAERRRFARLLGTDGELGCGLPIGTHSSQAVEGEATDDHPHHDEEPDQPTDDRSVSRSRDRRGTY